MISYIILLASPLTDEGTSVALCGLYRDYDDDSNARRQYPWLAKISVTVGIPIS